jgi:hypothetical protein
MPYHVTRELFSGPVVSVVGNRETADRVAASWEKATGVLHWVSYVEPPPLTGGEIFKRTMSGIVIAIVVGLVLLALANHKPHNVGYYDDAIYDAYTP